MQVAALVRRYPSARGSRVAFTAGTVAALLLIGACADAGKSITDPASVRNATTSSGGFSNAKHVDLCVDASSPAGNYTFVNSNENVNIGLNGQFDQGDGGSGTTLFNQPSGTPYTVAAGGCVRVLDRTAGDLLFPVPQANDSWAAVTITNTGTPGGAIYLRTDCVLDSGTLPAQPDPCGTNNNPTRAFANFEHGAVITFVFTAAPVSQNNCTYTQGYYKNHESYTAGVMSGNAGSTYINGAGLLLIGSYALTAAQVDDILGTPVGKGYNSGGVVFTKDQLSMIHQLITAELNIAGGAAPASISSIIAAANANYTTASKSQLSSWTNSLDNFNQGKLGPNHCS